MPGDSMRDRDIGPTRGSYKSPTFTAEVIILIVLAALFISGLVQ